MATKQSYEQGKLFALGMAVIGAEVDVIEAEVALELETNEDDIEYGKKRVEKERESLSRIYKLAKELNR